MERRASWTTGRAAAATSHVRTYSVSDGQPPVAHARPQAPPRPAASVTADTSRSRRSAAVRRDEILLFEAAGRGEIFSSARRDLSSRTGSALSTAAARSTSPMATEPLPSAASPSAEPFPFAPPPAREEGANAGAAVCVGCAG